MVPWWLLYLVTVDGFGLPKVSVAWNLRQKVLRRDGPLRVAMEPMQKRHFELPEDASPEAVFHRFQNISHTAEIFSKLPPIVATAANRGGAVVGAAAIASLAVAPISLFLGAAGAVGAGYATRLKLSPKIAEARYYGMQAAVAGALVMAVDDGRFQLAVDDPLQRDALKEKIQGIVRSWRLPTDFSNALLAEIYARYFKEVAWQHHETRVGDVESLATLIDILGLDIAWAGNAHFAATSELKSDCVVIRDGVRQSPASWANALRSKLIFMTERVTDRAFPNAFPEEIEYENLRMKDLWELSASEIADVKINTGLSFYSKAIEAALDELGESGLVTKELLLETQRKLNIDHARALQLHIRVFSKVLTEKIAIPNKIVKNIDSDEVTSFKAWRDRLRYPERYQNEAAEEVSMGEADAEDDEAYEEEEEYDEFDEEEEALLEEEEEPKRKKRTPEDELKALSKKMAEELSSIDAPGKKKKDEKNLQEIGKEDEVEKMDPKVVERLERDFLQEGGMLTEDEEEEFYDNIAAHPELFEGDWVPEAMKMLDLPAAKRTRIVMEALGMIFKKQTRMAFMGRMDPVACGKELGETMVTKCMISPSRARLEVKKHVQDQLNRQLSDFERAVKSLDLDGMYAEGQALGAKCDLAQTFWDGMGAVVLEDQHHAQNWKAHVARGIAMSIDKALALKAYEALLTKIVESTGAIAMSYDDKLALDQASKLMNLSEKEVSDVYRIVFARDLESLIPTDITDTDAIQTKIKDFLVSTGYPEDVFRQYAKEIYENRLKEASMGVGGAPRVLTKEERVQLDNLRVVLGIPEEEEDLEAAVARYTFPVYISSAEEAFANSPGGILTPEFLDGLEKLRDRLDMTPEDALRAKATAAMNFLKPQMTELVKNAKAETNDKFLTAEEKEDMLEAENKKEDVAYEGVTNFAEVRQRDEQKAREKAAKRAAAAEQRKGSERRLGIQSSNIGIVQSEDDNTDGLGSRIAKIVNFAEKNGFMKDGKYSLDLGQLIDTSAIRHVTAHYGILAYIEAASKPETSPESLKTFEKVIDDFGGMLGLTKKEMQNLKTTIGKKIIIQFYETMLFTKITPDAYDQKVIDAFQKMLEVDAGTAIFDAKKKFLKNQFQAAQRASMFGKLSKEELARLPMLRDRALAMGIDVSADLELFNQTRTNLFETEVMNLFETKEAMDDAASLIADMADTYDIDETTYDKIMTLVLYRAVDKGLRLTLIALQDVRIADACAAMDDLFPILHFIHHNTDEPIQIPSATPWNDKVEGERFIRAYTDHCEKQGVTDDRLKYAGAILGVTPPIYSDDLPAENDDDNA